MLGYRRREYFYWSYGVILLLSAVAFVVRLSQLDQFTLQEHIAIYAVSLFMVIFIWEALRNINNYLNKSLPFKASAFIKRRIVIQLAAGAFVGLLVRFLIYYFGEPLLPFKLDEMFWAATWVIYIIFPSLINLGFISYHFILRWRDSEIQNERLAREKSQVQFDNLKNQLNPHFLFNALTSLNSLIMENQQLASAFVQQLSKVYRYVLQNKDQSAVTVLTEVNFIKHYIALLQTRFQQGLQISIQLSAEAEEHKIVPVTLQILIENAIKHNIVSSDTPLKIEIYSSGNYLVVSNNLQVRSHVESSNKQGLENMKSLYAFLTSQPVLIEQTENRYSVKIPLL